MFCKYQAGFIEGLMNFQQSISGFWSVPTLINIKRSKRASENPLFMKPPMLWHSGESVFRLVPRHMVKHCHKTKARYLSGTVQRSWLIIYRVPRYFSLALGDFFIIKKQILYFCQGKKTEIRCITRGMLCNLIINAYLICVVNKSYLPRDGKALYRLQLPKL